MRGLVNSTLGRRPRVYLALMLAVPLASCGPSDELSAPSVESVSSSDRVQVDQVVQRLATALRNSEKTKLLTEPKFNLKAFASSRKNVFGPAGDWKIDSMQSFKSGAKVVVRTHFPSQDKEYRTNVVLKRQGDQWLIESITEPSYAIRPADVSGSASKGP